MRFSNISLQFALEI